MVGTIKWEPSNTQKETSPLAHFVRNSLPHKSAAFVPQCEKNGASNWKPANGNHFFLPLLLISFAIHCLAALPNALVVPYCHSLVSRNCIRYMEPSVYTRPRIWIRSLRSLAIQILYPPRRVCADGESHPPARLVIASLRSL